MQLFLKLFSGMANSVDPDQTAPEAVWSGSTLFAYAIYRNKKENIWDCQKLVLIGECLNVEWSK